MRTKPIIPIIFLCTSATALAQIPIARVGDVTRLQGQGTNVLMGMGIVTGLAGTGDGAKYSPAIKQLAEYLGRFGAEVEDFKEIAGAKNVAVVTIEATIPEEGAREGDHLDVSVTAHGAKSLEGGRLVSTPLIYNDPNVKDLFAFAQGPIVIEGAIKTVGVIPGGARMEHDVFMSVIATGMELRSNGFTAPWIALDQTYITLVLDEAHAGWSMAAAIAQAVDKELSISANVDRVALAMDSKSVVVLLPEHQRGDLASWVRDVERTPILMESNEARVSINRKAGTIVVTGDTRMSPVVVSQRGLTVTVMNPLPDGTPAPGPAFEQQEFVLLDVERNRPSNVKDLLEALNRLKVPFADRVAILKEMHRAGKLHARIMEEG